MHSTPDMNQPNSTHSTPDRSEPEPEQHAGGRTWLRSTVSKMDLISSPVKWNLRSRSPRRNSRSEIPWSESPSMSGRSNSAQDTPTHRDRETERETDRETER
eukprot:1902184-Rhodomonas_salina.1